MKKAIEFYLSLARLFATHSYHLYMVGGTSRDYLLGKDLSDLDFVTDAKPDDVISILPDVDKTFAKYGAFKYKQNDLKCDLLCFRIEKNYKDYRHPTKIRFTTDMQKDYKRRDFTINAIYIDDKFKIYDFSNGVDDLKNKVIRFIGNPKKRIKQDPLRIIRAIRFSLVLDFTIDKKTASAIKKHAYLLSNLNKDKIKEEVHKMNFISSDKVKEKFNEFTVSKYIEL